MLAEDYLYPVYTLESVVARHTLCPTMERQTSTDMHDEPSHETVDTEITCLTDSNRSLFNENRAVYETHSRSSLQQL